VNVGNSKSTSTIDQSIRLPDYFGCSNCVVYLNRHVMPFVDTADGKACKQAQAAGRCRADTLRQAIAAGAVQIHIVLPVGVQK